MATKPKCTETGCNKNASYAMFYDEPIFCITHGMAAGARKRYDICKCGSVRPSYSAVGDERPSYCKSCKPADAKNARKSGYCVECETRASYGPRNTRILMYCTRHRKSDSIDLINKLCSECDTIASFGLVKDKPTSCATHKTAEMINCRDAVCSEADCKKKPSYGYDWQKPIVCASHKKDNMKNVVSKRCEFEGCTKLASFGKDGKKSHCVEHKETDMKDTKKKCAKSDCNTRAGFGYDGGFATHCAIHKNPDMINLTSRCCAAEGCKIIPNFAIADEDIYYCSKHKTADMKDKQHKHCELCSTRANFGLSGGKPSRCSKHKEKGMIDLANSRCEYPDCNKISPSFGFKGDKGRRCKEHILEGMVDIRHKLCEIVGCKTQATYGLKDSRKPVRCVIHKLVNMITYKKTCKHPGCDIIPSFGFIDGKTEYCISHKLDGMTQLQMRNCAFDGCNINANFNTKGLKPLYCAKHKKKGMINTYSSICEFEDCDKIPSFGFVGHDPRFCAVHACEGMIDVKHSLCHCGTRTYYGNPGTLPTKCWKHREPGMIRRSKSKCKKCKEPAIYGKGFINLHCEKHKLEDEENYVEQTCSGCGLTMILDADNKCEYCIPAKFNAGRLAKQNALMEYLNSRGLHGTSTDKIVEGGVCGKERPDRIFDAGKFVVILECDEHQHLDRACDCEVSRMINIGQMFGGTPVLFIRFNPDTYSPADDSQDMEKISKRHKLVADYISDLLTERTKLPSSALVSVIYLYYDNWSSLAEEEIKILLEFENRISHV